jgi:hypothetical protein
MRIAGCQFSRCLGASSIEEVRARGSRGVALRGEAQVGERTVAIPVGDELDHLAVANVVEVRPPAADLRNIKAADLAAPTEADQQEDPFVVELAVARRLALVRRKRVARQTRKQRLLGDD